MKNKFSTSWKASSKPRKQRKYLLNAPLHLRGRMLNAMVSEDLGKKNSIKRIRIKVNDKVRAMRGKFKGKDGRVESVNLKDGKVKIAGFELTKKDGSKAKVAIHASNLMITELGSDDKMRLAAKK